ncbi:hypothetical protein LCGC14_2789360, partial [marine sediment metagenome]
MSARWVMTAKGTRQMMLGLGAAFIVATTPFVVQATTLTDTLRTAYLHSGLLEQNRATLRAADEGVAQAISTLRPVIGYTGNVTYSNPLNDSRDLRASLGLSADL